MSFQDTDPGAWTGAPVLHRSRFVVGGQVQGVGFRPFVYRIATQHGLTGFVRNAPDGVRIEVQGALQDLEGFAEDLRNELPPLARIVSLTQEDLPLLADEAGFRIERSAGGEGCQVLISPDTATCAECLAELLDPVDRRHLYPFINCTNCGPRYTITRGIPYDRVSTSMACFPLCARCQAEYEDPGHRRFHAQPNACPECGPRVWLADAGGRELSRDAEAIRQAARALTRGGIVALKGLGGFHLACDATSTRAVLELRARKARPHKPLAVMAPDLESARSLARITDGEARLLTGVERPIVLCRMLDRTPLSPELSPDAPFVGLMLPYTPLHHVLFALYRELLPPETAAALVMTSGNRSAEPIVLGNREALNRLGGIADLFLLHDRDILVRTDDSVLRLTPGHPAGQFLRRARGFTPSPVFLASPGPPVLGLGPQLKNTVCLTREDQAFVSQHIGDLENLETFAFFEEVIDHLRRILQVRPQAMIRDLHPDYLSTRYALEQAELPVRALQHHFAHIHAVLAEHRVEGPALGLALDGTGYGEDGTIWGGEALFVDSRTLEHARLGHLSPVPLPGGEAAIREPWRMAVSYLREMGGLERGIRPWPWEDEHGRDAERLIQVLDQGINSPPSTSAGRLFDAVAALLGLSMAVTYEGQAAVLLEGIQHGVDAQPYPCPVLDSRNPAVLDTLTLFSHVLEDWRQGVAPQVVSRRFHLGLIRGLADLAGWLAARTGVRTVALSGGVMQNLTMSVELPRMLAARGLTPLVHVHTPPNDGCISLGQAAWGRRACTD